MLILCLRKTYDYVLSLIRNVCVEFFWITAHFVEIAIPIVGEKLFAGLDIFADSVVDFSAVLNGDNILFV